VSLDAGVLISCRLNTVILQILEAHPEPDLFQEQWRIFDYPGETPAMMDADTKSNTRRWGLDTTIEALSARERLLNAAKVCYERKGIPKTTMEDIASEAKVTRRTVYRHFGSHQEVLNGVVHREANLFWAELLQHLAFTDSFEEFILEALIYTLKHAPETPTHSFLFDQDILPVVNQIYLSSEDFICQRAEILRPVYERFSPDTELDLVMVTEWFNRIAVSYLATPSPFYQTEDELRILFRAMLLPVFS
jgi:AcrR family transcriptional regulator